MRRKMSKGLDRKMFRTTARHSKAINVVPTVSRGGIRL